MNKNCMITGLALAPNFAHAHEGIDPASLLHSFAHLGESYGLLAAIPLALVVFVALRRKRAAIKHDARK